MTRIAIIDGVRTPFIKMGTLFNDLSAQELGRIVSRELIERLNLNVNVIDEVIFGNVAQPADATNIARVIALLSGIPVTTPAFSVQRNCASGIESILTSAAKIQIGEANCVLAGGTESMSNIPIFLSKDLQEILMNFNKAKTLSERIKVLLSLKLKFLSPRVGLTLGLTDPICGLNMGQTAEVLAKEFGISREEQDAFALLSHQKAIAAQKTLEEEIIPVFPAPKYKKVVLTDNGPRENQTLEALAKLKPIFDRYSGTVTAGNSSQVTDGAAAVLVMSEEKARELQLKPLGFIRSFAVSGVEPQRMGIGPAHAIPKALKKASLKMHDIQAFEINEAFAVQTIACLKLLESEKFTEKFGYQGYTGAIDPQLLNVHGGAIALGHPVGATGTRLILTMLKHLNRKNLNLGLVSLCIGGGQGVAVILEKA